MQKSRFLNLVLATAVLILTILLTTKENSSEKPAATTVIATDDSPFAASDSSTLPFQKKSVGIKSYLYPQPAMVIGSYDKEGKPNIMTAAWIGICNSDPLSIAVSLRPATYSYGNVTETRSFTVNVPSSQLSKYVSYAGRYSGRDVDKFKETGLTPVRGEYVNAPYIKEFPIVIECEVTAINELGSHRQFIGKVIDVKVDEAILDARGNVDLGLLNPIIYAGGSFYETGSLIPRADRSAENIDGKPFVVNYNERYMNKTLEVIHNRKSVRHFTNQAITKEQIETLLRAGMAAPTAVNRQPWAFYVITQRETLDILSEKLPYAKMLSQAQAAIVVCGDMEKAGNLKDLAYWVQDCSAATQNILLAAESMGLGAVWTAAYPYDDRAKAVIEELNLPETHIPLNVIPIGYPTGEDLPKNKWNVDNIIWK